jgi:hypothetical protein
VNEGTSAIRLSVWKAVLTARCNPAVPLETTATLASAPTHRSSLDVNSTSIGPLLLKMPRSTMAA